MVGYSGWVYMIGWCLGLALGLEHFHGVGGRKEEHYSCK
jgi:hypothetical protein